VEAELRKEPTANEGTRNSHEEVAGAREQSDPFVGALLRRDTLRRGSVVTSSVAYSAACNILP
jgi:hypothetical protein